LAQNESSSRRPGKNDCEGCSGAPHVIHNEKELEVYTNALFQLTALEEPSSAEVEAIELLTLLVERYEQAHYAIPEADAVSVVRFFIEQQGLTQRDLTPEFGSESAVSMFLAGQRKLTLEQVRKLSSRFTLSADVFIRRPQLRPQTKILPRSSDLAVTGLPTIQNGLVELLSTFLSLHYCCFFSPCLSLLNSVRLEPPQPSVISSCG
jgi:HTH-type transcriptional regulator/antitoxin HigA